MRKCTYLKRNAFRDSVLFLKLIIFVLSTRSFLPVSSTFQNEVFECLSNRQWRHHERTGEGLVSPNPKIWQKLTKKNGIKVGLYAFRLKNYVQIPPNFFWIFHTWRRHCKSVWITKIDSFFNYFCLNWNFFISSHLRVKFLMGCFFLEKIRVVHAKSYDGQTINIIRPPRPCSNGPPCRSKKTHA